MPKLVCANVTVVYRSDTKYQYTEAVEVVWQDGSFDAIVEHIKQIALDKRGANKDNYYVGKVEYDIRPLELVEPEGFVAPPCDPSFEATQSKIRAHTDELARLVELRMQLAGNEGSEGIGNAIDAVAGEIARLTTLEAEVATSLR